MTLPERADVVIVGGGPAGLAAAIQLRAQGHSVVVLEREAEAGGIPRHCGHYPFGMREFQRLMRGPAYAARLVAEARAAGVLVATRTTVTALHPGPRLSVTTPEGPSEIGARRVLLATGLRESSRAARGIGGSKPGGVLSTGALQQLVYLPQSHGLPRPYLQPVILGSEMVAFSALLTCRHAGIRPRAMIEPGSRVTARWPAPLLPRALGVPLHLETALVAIHGRHQVEGVTLRHRGTERTLPCDGVIISGKFRPEASLIRASHLRFDPASGGPEVDQYGRCSDPGYFAAGNLLHPVETAGWCWAEGRRVAAALAASLSGALPDADVAQHIRAAGALAYLVPQRRVPMVPGVPVALAPQLRAAAEMRGRLVLRQAGAEIAAQAMTARPERRLHLKPGLLAAAGPGDFDLALEAET
ncbi:NAD(P)/FAD-dependent oxidoreductase [Phaeovulum sp. W22_SRMD_FR3]|uniref:NAD(P)/FAD-dependent oxidoreductase n=1 Tax=Phaeovulum sp. W22_SRMD_FR3 TaxID=3240274 RepID=UPI003F9789D6